MKFRNFRDFFAVKGEIPLDQNADPSSTPFVVTLTNANGLIYAGVLLPGEFEMKGKRFSYKNKEAKVGPGPGGLFKVQLKPAKSGLWRFKIQAFADDLTAATLPEMTVTVTVAGSTYQSTALYKKTKKGWKLDRFPLR